MHYPRFVRPLGVLVALAVLAIGATACSSSPSASHFTPKPYKHLYLYRYHTSYGTVVGSIDGVVAYANKDESGGKIACTGNCTNTWTPWVTDGVKLIAGKGVQQSLIGTVKRPGGQLQMTYGGHPLYLYAHETHTLQANAQGAGGVWYVVGTNGKLIT